MSTTATPHDAVAALSRQLRDQPGSVLVLEDLHWADEATLDVLRLLARRIDDVPVLVLASYRDDQLDRYHPLRLVLGEIGGGPSRRRVGLSALSRESVGHLARPYGVDADELFAKTSGNPFFVHEALAGEEDAIPDTVRDALLVRASRLTAPARTLLEAVAVVPPMAEVWLLEAPAGDALDPVRTGAAVCGPAHTCGARRPAREPLRRVLRHRPVRRRHRLPRGGRSYQAPERFQDIARYLGLPASTPAEAVESYARAIEDLRDRAGIERSFQAVGVDERAFLASLPQQSLNAYEDQCAPANPRMPMLDDMQRLMRQAYFGSVAAAGASES